jgi:hypothetical protein
MSAAVKESSFKCRLCIVNSLGSYILLDMLREGGCRGGVLLEENQQAAGIGHKVVLMALRIVTN